MATNRFRLICARFVDNAHAATPQFAHELVPGNLRETHATGLISGRGQR